MFRRGRTEHERRYAELTKAGDRMARVLDRGPSDMNGVLVLTQGENHTFRAVGMDDPKEAVDLLLNGIRALAEAYGLGVEIEETIEAIIPEPGDPRAN